MKSVTVAAAIMLMSCQVMASGSVLINGKEIKSQDHLHDLFAKQLKFPNYYGKNLESLYDMLSTDFSGNAIVKIKSMSILKRKLGNEYGEALIQTIMDASRDNPRIVLVVE